MNTLRTLTPDPDPKDKKATTMSNTESSGGIGFCGLLALLFIGLKLGGVIAWSWLWVLSPLWIPLAIGITFAAFLSLIGLAAYLANK